DVERWFQQARVNTCLVVLEKCTDAATRAANRVRLVSLGRPLRELIPYEVNDKQRLSHVEQLTMRLLPGHDTAGRDFAVRVVPQRELAAGDKWGVALRAPAVYRQRAREAPLYPLQNWATIQRGYTTGANAFFYLNPDTIARWGIEPHFRRPLLKSLRQVSRRQVAPGDCDQEVLRVPPTARLDGTAAGAYIAWGEAQGLSQRRTCAGRQPWYSLPEQKSAPLLLAKGIWERHFASLSAGDILVDQQLYQVYLSSDVPPLAAAALLNSAWFALQVELHGRVNFGEGVLWLATYELEALRLPDPRYLLANQVDELVALYREVADCLVVEVQREVTQPAWQALNAAVFGLLGLSAAEGQAIITALLERVAARQARARRPGEPLTSQTVPPLEE
ncbi:MAG: hypothetical protein L0322_03660, partial [Chloroflexi bacterium]|nr:hypothetical protein [Chloroflexota bacterium]